MKYLPILQSSQEWLSEKSNFIKSGVILVATEIINRGQWPLEMTDVDGLVPAVFVHIANGIPRSDTRKLYY